MKISGIICEYNPLHNGHLYHLEQVRRGGAEGIVAVMSGNFVQRGDAALLDKFTRAVLPLRAVSIWCWNCRCPMLWLRRRTSPWAALHF